MNLGQYVGRTIRWKGREARVVRFTDSSEEMYFTCRYADTNEVFFLNAQEADTMRAVRGEPEEPAAPAAGDPDGAVRFTLGLRREADGTLWFSAYGQEFLVTSHSYEPCTYLRAEGAAEPITIHNAFDVTELSRLVAAGGSVSAITGRRYGPAGICALLAEAVRGGRREYQIDDVESLLVSGGADSGANERPKAEKPPAPPVRLEL